ncbi:MAG TPA: class I SAM-dependent methyltransferase [Gaiellaceae bacterium]|nr:class I SAM-dependent methyltransferase [Gaiellaceae bacterium]
MPDDVWNPETYLDEMHAEIPGYEELQDAVAAATDGLDAREILELGTGTGETAVRVLARHPGARWTGIDASEAMLARARERLPDAELLVRRLEEPLPAGPFDVVVSVLAVHHLDGAGKRDLFARVAAALRPDGRFVLGDLVVPRAGEEGPIFVDWEMDLPDPVADQLEWLRDAGFDATATDVRADLAVLHAIRAH